MSAFKESEIQRALQSAAEKLGYATVRSLDRGGVEQTGECASRAADWLEEPAMPFILLSSRVSSSEICFLSLESFSKFLKHGTHKNEFESVTDTVQRGNLWRAKLVNTGTTCLEADLTRL